MLALSRSCLGVCQIDYTDTARTELRKARQKHSTAHRGLHGRAHCTTGRSAERRPEGPTIGLGERRQWPPWPACKPAGPRPFNSRTTDPYYRQGDGSPDSRSRPPNSLDHCSVVWDAEPTLGPASSDGRLHLQRHLRPIELDNVWIVPVILEYREHS